MQRTARQVGCKYTGPVTRIHREPESESESMPAATVGTSAATQDPTTASNRPTGIAPSTPDSEKFDQPNGNRAKGPGLSGWGYPTREPAFRIKPARAPRDSLPAATAAGLVMEAASDIGQVT